MSTDDPGQLPDFGAAADEVFRRMFTAALWVGGLLAAMFIVALAVALVMFAGDYLTARRRRNTPEGLEERATASEKAFADTLTAFREELPEGVGELTGWDYGDWFEQHVAWPIREIRGTQEKPWKHGTEKKLAAEPVPARHGLVPVVLESPDPIKAAVAKPAKPRRAPRETIKQAMADQLLLSTRDREVLHLLCNSPWTAGSVMTLPSGRKLRGPWTPVLDEDIAAVAAIEATLAGLRERLTAALASDVVNVAEIQKIADELNAETAKHNAIEARHP